MNVCCSRCFAYEWMSGRVRSRSRKTGSCDYCGATNVKILGIKSLEPCFRNWLSMYQLDPLRGVDSNYETLIEKAQGHWMLFSADLDPSIQCALLEDILNCGRPSTSTPIDATDYYKSASQDEAQDWINFCRGLPQTQGAGSSRNQARDSLAVFETQQTVNEMIERGEAKVNSGTVFYRARLGSASPWGGGTPYTGTEIGAPPADKAREARANKAGQRVLYCANKEITAVSEVRPARGALVSVCKLTLQQEIRVLDLVDLPQQLNPFAGPLPFLHESSVYGLLHRFAEEMSTPLRYDDDHTEYLQSQCICEAVMRSGIAGILYPSALCRKGANLVIFDPDIVKIHESHLVEVDTMVVKYKVLRKVSPR